MSKILNQFWKWYEKHLKVNTVVAVILFTLQLIHLYWLTTHVVSMRLNGISYFNLSGIWQILILLVDYTEIPAIITTSLIYINDFRKGIKFKSLLFLILLNSQWLHIFWITDEFVVEQLVGVSGVGMPILLSWIAIGIDYLELPVIFDLIRRSLISFKSKMLK